MTSKKNGKGTFVVHVHCRQNTTWQGEVVWADRNKKQSFRSVMELLNLMESALDLTDIEEKQKEGHANGREKRTRQTSQKEIHKSAPKRDALDVAVRPGSDL